MINVLEHVLYQEDIAVVAESKLPWERLKNSSVLISGARGMIGSALIDVIMYRNQKYDMSCKIYALGRDEEKAKERFSFMGH